MEANRQERQRKVGGYIRAHADSGERNQECGEHNDIKSTLMQSRRWNERRNSLPRHWWHQCPVRHRIDKEHQSARVFSTFPRLLNHKVLKPEAWTGFNSVWFDGGEPSPRLHRRLACTHQGSFQ